MLMDTEPQSVAPVVSAALSGYRDYEQQIADWVAKSGI
jgi:hypothetical protein